MLADNVDPDQMPHYVASDLGLHCLPETLAFYRFPGLNCEINSTSLCIEFFLVKSSLRDVCVTHS